MWSADPFPRRRDRSRPPDQVANAHRDQVDLAPVDTTPAQDVRDAWRAWMPGQPIPLPWED